MVQLDHNVNRRVIKSLHISGVEQEVKEELPDLVSYEEDEDEHDQRGLFFKKKMTRTMKN